jgi:hypothetical protein
LRSGNLDTASLMLQPTAMQHARATPWVLPNPHPGAVQ